MEEARGESETARTLGRAHSLQGQVVLAVQGGGALGAYQGGVYQALHEAGIEPNWVIGTSIGAINGAIIAGNDPSQRLERLCEFWDRMGRKSLWGAGPFTLTGGNVAVRLMTIFGGIDGYFSPKSCSRLGPACVARRRKSRVLYDRRIARDTFRRSRPLAHHLWSAAVDRRRGQCSVRQDALFRQPRYAHHA